MRFLKKIIKKARIVVFSGTRYKCPFCGYGSNRLGKFGFSNAVIAKKQIIGSGLRRSRCYNCNSSDRERLVYAYIEKELNFFESNKDSKILHISPEPHLSGYIQGRKYAEYIGGDLFTEGYHYPEFVQNMDITKIPFPENYFDLIICNHVLEHIPEDNMAMRELLRVLKPSGLAILQVPISLVLDNTLEDPTIITHQQRAEVFGQYDHVRIYGQDYPKKLSMAGFKVNVINISMKYTKMGLNEKELLYTASKQ